MRKAHTIFQRYIRDQPAILLARHSVRIASNPQAVAISEDPINADATSSARIPAKRNPIAYIQSRQPLPAYRAWPLPVAGEWVIHPALMPTDVDCAVGHFNRGKRVSTRII